MKDPENTKDVMRILGSLFFYSTFIKNLHEDSKPFDELLRDDISFQWTGEQEKLFQNMKDPTTDETILAVPNPKNPFHIRVDSSSIVTGSILVQEYANGKRTIFNSRVFTKYEQMKSTLHREVCGIKCPLKTYEHFIIDSPDLIHNFCEHKRLLYL